ncbi:MAG: CaiB/BaiF CoA transferase family protein, partial [Chloroflexus sp.]
MPTALADLLILDFSRVLAGPYATMVLADMGARVIKIEQPGTGDETRRWGPPFADNGLSAYFIAVNRNKQSITLNLKHPTGQAIARELASRADVLIENFLPGTMARMGLGYNDLRPLNPRLIYCSITGYGQYGPDANRPGYDTVIQAEGGLMS